MKLICLNIWGGKIYKPLMKFIRDHSEDTDIFCFQEVLNSNQSRQTKGRIFKESQTDIYIQLKNLLANYNSYYSADFDLKEFGGEADFTVDIGMATFVKKDLILVKSNHHFVHNDKYNNLKKDEGFIDMPRSLQYVNIEKGDLNYWIFNYHGVWVPGPKTDNEFRLNASKKIREIMDSKSGKKILCGDFNLLPDTKSQLILEKGMRSLIKENNITSTRSKYFDRDLSQYSDYVIVSEDIKVNNFEVLKDEVSDHLSLLLEFD